MTSKKLENLQKLKINVETKFEKIRESLNLREKLLQRQIDVIKNQLKNPTEKQFIDEEIQFLTENEDQLMNIIRSFGKFTIDNLSNDVYMKSEDYITPQIDHEIMHKCLINNETEDQEMFFVDFSHNKKLIEENVCTMNESIISITLNEARELIRTAARNSMLFVPELNFKNLDEELQSCATNENLSFSSEKESEKLSDKIPSNSKFSQTEGNPKRKLRSLKPKITINNCNGTINLKNISNLTINCANEEAMHAEIPLNVTEQNIKPKVPSTSTSISELSSSTIASDENNKQKENSLNNHQMPDIMISNNNTFPSLQIEDTEAVTFEFYNRLLNEIKNSIKTKSNKNKLDKNYEKSLTNSQTSNSHPNETTTSSNSSNNNKEKKLIVKNLENLKVILEPKDNDDNVHLYPIQIEQWLAEIISETEIEPMQNIEILEHSKINKEIS